jgi:hypothetical protein
MAGENKYENQLTTSVNYVNLTTMKAIPDIGRQLVEHAEQAETFSARRGIVEELFPFIFEASHRMSLRAISRWLAAEQKISVSPQAIAKAMRDPGKYWVRALEGIEPAVRVVAIAHDVEPAQILTEPDALEYVQANVPAFSNPDESAFRRYDDALRAVVEFKQGMPPDALRECLGYVPAVFGEVKAKKGANHARTRTGKKR